MSFVAKSIKFEAAFLTWDHLFQISRGAAEAQRIRDRPNNKISASPHLRVRSEIKVPLSLDFGSFLLALIQYFSCAQKTSRNISPPSLPNSPFFAEIIGKSKKTEKIVKVYQIDSISEIILTDIKYITRKYWD